MKVFSERKISQTENLPFRPGAYVQMNAIWEWIIIALKTQDVSVFKNWSHLTLMDIKYQHWSLTIKKFPIPQSKAIQRPWGYQQIVVLCFLGVECCKNIYSGPGNWNVKNELPIIFAVIAADYL